MKIAVEIDRIPKIASNSIIKVSEISGFHYNLTIPKKWRPNTLTYLQ